METPAGHSRPKLSNSNKLVINKRSCQMDWMTFIVDLTLKTSDLNKLRSDQNYMEGRRMMLKILRLTPWLSRKKNNLKLNTRKAVGSDNICGRLLKLCTFHLSVVFSQLLTWSLKENTVLYTWKTSVLKTTKSLFKRLSPDCFDIYCNEVFWKYRSSPAHKTHEAPFILIPILIQPQQ